jgi:site-specific DNA-methyltransferase (adenine-specific)
MLALNEFYNMNCMEGMQQFPDKYFDLAIVDPPYGIGEDGGKNRAGPQSFRKGLKSRNYKKKIGISDPQKNIFMNCSGYPKIK